MKRLTQIFQALLGVVALILTAIVAFGRLAWRTIRNWWKKRSKWLRRSIATILILIPVGFAALVAYVYYDCEYGVPRTNMRLSTDVHIHEFADYKERIYNCKRKSYTTPKIDWRVADEHGGELAVYAQNGKRGYFNIYTGDIVIDAAEHNYTKAWLFSEGLAAVVKDGKIGYIDAQGRVVIPFKFDYSHNGSEWDNGYIFYNGYCKMTNQEGDWGLIDKSGNWVVEASYDEIWAPHKSGYRTIVKDGKFGVLDTQCQIVYPAEYLFLRVMSDGFVLTKGGKQWQVDFEGNIVQLFLFDDIYNLNYSIGYDESGDVKYAFADYVMYEIMGRYGIMNRITGEPITLALYSGIKMLSRDIFEVQEHDSYEWYLLDTKGNVVSKK